jgi:hypothetical protein
MVWARGTSRQAAVWRRTKRDCVLEVCLEAGTVVLASALLILGAAQPVLKAELSAELALKRLRQTDDVSSNENASEKTVLVDRYQFNQNRTGSSCLVSLIWGRRQPTTVASTVPPDSLLRH